MLRKSINFLVIASFVSSQSLFAFEERGFSKEGSRLEDRQVNRTNIDSARQKVESSPKAQEDIQNAKNNENLKDNLKTDKDKHDAKEDIKHDKDKYEAKQDVKKVEENPKTQEDLNKLQSDKTNNTNINYSPQKTYNTSYQAPSYSSGWGGGTGFWAGVATVTGIALVSSWISSMFFKPQPAAAAASPTYVTNNYSSQAPAAQPVVVNNYYNDNNSSGQTSNAPAQVADQSANGNQQAQNPQMQQPEQEGQSGFMKIIGYLAGITIWLMLLSGLYLLVRKIRNK